MRTETIILSKSVSSVAKTWRWLFLFSTEIYFCWIIIINASKSHTVALDVILPLYPEHGHWFFLDLIYRYHCLNSLEHQIHAYIKSQLKMVPDKFTIYFCLVICRYVSLFLLMSLTGTHWLGATSHRYPGHVAVLTNTLVFLWDYRIFTSLMLWLSDT